MKSTFAVAVHDRGPEREGGDCERCGEREQRAASPARSELHGLVEPRLGRRASRDEELVHTLEARALDRLEIRTDERVEVGRHRTSSSRASARRARALLVRVLTVPRGMWSRSATSLCESPPQYASSITGRSCSGSTSSAR